MHRPWVAALSPQHKQKKHKTHHRKKLRYELFPCPTLKEIQPVKPACASLLKKKPPPRKKIHPMLQSLSLNPQPSLFLFLNQKQSRHKKRLRKVLTRQPPQMSPNLLKKQLRQQKHSKNWKMLLQLNPFSFLMKFLILAK